MGKKQLAVNLISNIVALGTSLAISFILTPYLIRTTGKEAYSFYPLSNNFVSYMMIITTALNSMASRFITIEIVKKNEHKAKKYYSSVFFSNCIMAAILLVPMSIIIITMEDFMDIPNTLTYEVKLLFFLIFASMLVNLISSIFGVAAFAKNRLDYTSGKEIIQGILKVVLFLLLYSVFTPSIVFVGIVTLILSITNFIIQYIITKKLLPDIILSIKYFEYSLVKEIFSAGVWNSINSMGSILMNGVSIIISNIFINASASGELSIIQTLPHFLSSIITMLLAVFMPRITHVYATGTKQSLVNEMKFSQKIISLFTTVPIAIIIIFGQDFFTLWVPNENSTRLQLLSVISLIPLIVHGNMWPLIGLNTVLNKVKTPSLILIGTGLMNIISCYIFLNYINDSIIIIPIISSLLSVLYYLFFIPIYASVQLKISKLTFYPTIIKSIISVILFVAFGFCLHDYLQIDSWFTFFINCCKFGLIGVLINIVILLNKKDYIKIFDFLKHYYSVSKYNKINNK